MPDIAAFFKPGLTNTQIAAIISLYNLYKYAVAYLQQSPLSPRNRKTGINELFVLLDQPLLASQPLLHAMTHATIAVNTQFDERNICQYKTKHLDLAADVVFDLRKYKHGSGIECQGCIWNKLQSDQGKYAGQEDTSECNTIARLERVIADEKFRVQKFNWGDFDVEMLYG